MKKSLVYSSVLLPKFTFSARIKLCYCMSPIIMSLNIHIRKIYFCLHVYIMPNGTNYTNMCTTHSLHLGVFLFFFFVIEIIKVTV